MPSKKSTHTLGEKAVRRLAEMNRLVGHREVIDEVPERSKKHKRFPADAGTRVVSAVISEDLYAGSGNTAATVNGNSVVITNNNPSGFIFSGSTITALKIRGEYYCLEGGEHTIVGELQGSLTSGGSQDIEVDTPTVALGLTINVKEAIGLTDALSSGTNVLAIWQAGNQRWIAIAAECS